MNINNVSRNYIYRSNRHLKPTRCRLTCHPSLIYAYPYVTAETTLVGVVRGTQMPPVGTPAAGAKGKDETPSQSTFRLQPVS